MVKDAGILRGDSSMEEKVVIILNEMSEYLSISQMKKLQEVILKFKLPPKPVPKIDLQEWKDMQKLMYELQRQSIEIKRTQQDISSLKKQLSELRGLFKGKERKSLEGRIELLEDLEKRLHKSLKQIVKREGYPNVQAFQKVYNKAEELIIEYNEELRAWKNQTEQKKEKPMSQKMFKVI